jgi:hypothetical protein
MDKIHKPSDYERTVSCHCVPQFSYFLGVNVVLVQNYLCRLKRLSFLPALYPLLASTYRSKNIKKRRFIHSYKFI